MLRLLTDENFNGDIVRGLQKLDASTPSISGSH